MPNHANRCMQVTCNFTHPSSQTGNRVYPSDRYIYSFPNDGLAVTIQSQAKRQYAADYNIRAGWIGFIAINTSIRNNMRPTHNLHDNPVFPT